MDFDDRDWKQIAGDPPEFEAISDYVILDIFDVSQKSYKLKFAKGAKIKSRRVVGKFRLTWDDSGLLSKT